ncbi:MAG: quinone-interacting membrane-bound oxidoreductase complex subunit QmoC [Candidatus Desulfofervidaceae bacterium]|nr:quinone-interacting membrane-bound oxidoreductase complex subunit QmoC [Candidatus Desulfofervidaceae bacterium]
MANGRLVEPDLKFINGVIELGGSSLKKCFQCATCSVVCPLSSEDDPFPRKQMIMAQWGQKEALIKDKNIWLCHQCQDCSAYCPRGARPGDVLGAIRAFAIEKYATPKWLAKLVREPKYLPLLFIVPIILFLFIALLNGTLPPKAGEIRPSHFIPDTTGLDLVFVPLSILLGVALFKSLSRFWKDISAGLVEKPSAYQMLLKGGWWGILFSTAKEILSHARFRKCGASANRTVPHFLLLWSFIGLFIVTGIGFVAEYIFHIELPFPMTNPVKWLANISAVALILGALMILINRLQDKDAPKTYWDLSLIWIILAVGVTGALAEIFRLVEMAFWAYGFYLLHLASVFVLFLYLPYSKFAHLAYRTLAMVYEKYSSKA